MNGKLYGVGVGPGDPELLTLKALRVIKEVDIILVPGKTSNARPDESIAYTIIQGVYPKISERHVKTISMPMTKDKDELEKIHEIGAKEVSDLLKDGKEVAFITLGDPTIYSTYLYIHKKILEMGFDAEIISGIPSFCAVAARLNIGLSEQAEQIHIIPASYDAQEALKLPGTKVLMKAGRKIKDVKKYLLNSNSECLMIENCGLEDEKIYKSVEEIPDDSGYYSIIVVKQSKES